MNKTKEINTETLRYWLDSKKAVNILDIRPVSEREEWQIPGSVHTDVYEQLKTNDPKVMDKIDLDKSTPVVTVCAGGNKSLIAADLLRTHGYEAYSLQGGMKGWSLSWNIARQTFPDFEIVQFRRTGKGCLSYMIISNKEAMVVDASLDEKVYQDFIVKEKLKLKFVVDTHIHADHLTRSMALAKLYGIKPHLPVNGKVKYPFNPIEDNMVFKVGSIHINSIHTPGHTHESTSYLVNEKVLLTGDTLFTDGVGRSDLKAETDEVVKKAKLLYHSLLSLLTLDENTIVMPGHASNPVSFDGVMLQSTLKDIKKKVHMLQMDENTFVETIINRIPPLPPNYQTIVEHNMTGNFDDVNTLDLEAGANRCAIS